MEQLPDIRTLSALVHASPRCHHTYRGWRSLLLQTVLWNELEHDVVSSVDFMAAIEASHLDLDGCYRVERVQSFLYGYDRNRWITKTASPSRPPFPVFRTWFRGVGASAALHLRAAVSYLTTDFCRFVSESLHSSQFGARSSMTSVWVPSVSERRRIQRAFYRFEIFRCLFGPAAMELYHDKAQLDLSREVARFLTVVLRGWESEELACVVEYMDRCWSRLFQIDRERRANGGESLSTEEASMRAHEDAIYKERLMSWSPCVLHHALRSRGGRKGRWKRKQKDKEQHDPPDWRPRLDRQLSRLMDTADFTTRERVYLPRPYLPRVSLTDALDIDPLVVNHLRRTLPPRIIQRRQQHPSYFLHDDDEHEPSAAWIWASNNIADELFDNRFRLSDFRRHAYIMWDQSWLSIWMDGRPLDDFLRQMGRSR